MTNASELFYANHPSMIAPAEIVYRDKKYKVKRGTPISEFMKKHPNSEDKDVFAANMNHLIVSLDTQIVRSGTIEPITYKSHHGARLYRRHLTLMLYEVFYSLYPGHTIKIGQAISEGFYFEVDGVKITKKVLTKIEEELKKLASEKRPFIGQRVPVEEARRLFVHSGAAFKKQVLDHWPSAYVTIITLGNFVDFALGPIAPHTGYFKKFKLIPSGKDFILQFPDQKIKDFKRNANSQPKLFKTLKESRKWSELLGVRHVGDLNEVCVNGKIREIVQISEGLHENRVATIVDKIIKSKKRLVLIAGPSSSGKTTFSKRLSIQLRACGVTPVSISLDNYYVNRDKTPKDDTGKYDFEALEAIDIKLFNNNLRDILKGKTVLTPKYNFNTGKRESKDKWTPVKLEKDHILTIEGIHGLNNALTPAVRSDNKFKIYINALNPLAIDEHNRIQTSDTRLIRRIVRDRHYRGYSAAETIATWDSVRRGERKHIFPYQESADVIFDSSLIYEFAALKIFAERYLLEVMRTHPSFAEAYRLRKFLSTFVPMLPGDIPQNSLIREFIGGSGFSY